MYFEDVDLCLRTKSLGFKVYVFSQAKIAHFGGKSLKENKERKKIYFQSQDYFYQKHYGWWQWLILKIFQKPYQFFKYGLT